VHVLSPAVFDFMSPEGAEDINRVVYVRMMEAGLALRGHLVDAYWSDVGTPARYLTAQADLLYARVPLEAFPGASPFGTIGARTSGEEIIQPSLVDRAAELRRGAVVGPGSYVGRGASIGEGARVRQSAVLDDTRVHPGEDLANSIAFGPHRLTTA
jgi:mannose-1-phosphate guanylyltransferase